MMLVVIMVVVMMLVVVMLVVMMIVVMMIVVSILFTVGIACSFLSRMVTLVSITGSND